MNSRWDDTAAKNLDGLGLLVYASRLVGAETSLVVWGGGNTSIKLAERDYRGREVRVLRVKGSGSDLKSIAGGMPLGAVVGRKALLDCLPKGGLGGTYSGNPIACAAALATDRKSVV